MHLFIFKIKKIYCFVNLGLAGKVLENVRTSVLVLQHLYRRTVPYVVRRQRVGGATRVQNTGGFLLSVRETKNIQ